MNFVENLFGIAPDGGSGALEITLLVLPLAVACFLRARRGLARVMFRS